MEPRDLGYQCRGGSISYSQRVQIVRTPGSVSSHLAAQSGLFTVQKVERQPQQSIEPRDLKEEFMVHGSRDILKLTVPG